jgi:nucleoside phosphorylase
MLTIPGAASKRPKLLVVAAWEPELARLRDRIASNAGPGAPVVFDGDKGGLGPSGLEITLETVGVGLVEAAIGMTRCIVRHRPDAALLIGTCGAFGDATAIGAVVTGVGVCIADASVLGGTAALPPPLPAEAIFDTALLAVLVSAGAKSVQIANSVGITVDDALAASLAALGDVEHLEAFGFARACAAADLPCAVALGVANVVGARGRSEWLANHVSASSRAGDLAYGVLSELANVVRGFHVRTTTTTP